MKIPRILLTVGEPAGIGPDIIIKMAQHSFAVPVNIVVRADEQMLAARAKQLGLPLRLIAYDANKPNQIAEKSELIVSHYPLSQKSVPGLLEVANADYVLNTIKWAALACVRHEFDAMVTGPVHKGIINQAGKAFSGHTEYLAQLTNSPQVVMMLAVDKLRVALVTTHLPLSAVSQAITQEHLSEVVNILNRDLQAKFAIDRPKILVCGLNPHAGENGYLGREEIDIIEPVLRRLLIQGVNLEGPLPADTVFTPYHLANADAVLAMYHDQGLPIIKYCGFGHAVNITLGLPIIRTSVDHGTALDKAGTNQANEGSLLAAIKMAVDMVRRLQT